MKKASVLLVILGLFVCQILTSCNPKMYSQEKGLRYKDCPANDAIGYWYKKGTGNNYNPRLKKHVFLF